MHQRAFHPNLESICCFLCGADDFDVVYEAQYDREKDVDPAVKFRASGDELLVDQLVKCRQCSFQYVNPRIRGDLIFAGYTEGDDPTYVSQIEARERTFTHSLREIERAVGGAGKLLDVGTAAGAFVAAARGRGWDAEGCEPNAWLAQWGAAHYGIVIRQGSVFDHQYAEGSFDAVTLWDVIEHTLNPREMLEHCRRLLKPGGVLIVNYPDIGSSIARVLGRRWLFLTSVHLYYFDRTTITRMLGATGFRVEAMRPHWQRLELDYVLFRAALVSPGMSKLSRALVRLVRAGKLQVPYWLGQTFVVARRERS